MYYQLVKACHVGTCHVSQNVLESRSTSLYNILKNLI